jgi:hypothetical protein
MESKIVGVKRKPKRKRKPKSISKDGNGEEIGSSGYIKTFATPAPIKAIPSPKRSI